MKKKLTFLGISICLLLSLCACGKMSDKKLDNIKKEYEEYLADTYPGETFTVDVWQEYSTFGTSAFPVPYSGYIIRSIVTDSDGNRFKILTSNNKYFDDRDMVLDGRREYNEKGQRILRLDDGSVIYTD